MPQGCFCQTLKTVRRFNLLQQFGIQCESLTELPELTVKFADIFKPFKDSQ